MQTPDMRDPLDQTKAAFQLMMQQMSGPDLRDFFQIVVGEMFIRAENDEDFQTGWASLSGSVVEMFNPDTSPDRETLQGYLDAREELNVQREKRFTNAFESEASAELSALFDEHGVIEDETPDDTPGLYL